MALEEAVSALAAAVARLGASIDNMRQDVGNDTSDTPTLLQMRADIGARADSFKGPPVDSPAVVGANRQIADFPADPAPTAPAKRPVGRPRKNPPAAPLEQAAHANGAAAGTVAAAPAATYADLQQLVPALAERDGRAAALAIFAKLGVASGVAIKDDPAQIQRAVALFKHALDVAGKGQA